jgi:hypothetical protein
VKLPALTPRRLAIVALGAALCVLAAFAWGRRGRSRAEVDYSQVRDGKADGSWGSAMKGKVAERRNVIVVRERFEPATGLLTERLTLRDTTATNTRTEATEQGQVKVEERVETRYVEKPVADAFRLLGGPEWRAKQPAPTDWRVQAGFRAGVVWVEPNISFQAKDNGLPSGKVSGVGVMVGGAW